MRDGILMARRDTPVVALVTDEFWAQGDFVARAGGMPDVPRVRLPHPVAGTGADHMATVAAGVVDEIIAAWRGAAATA